MYDPRKDRFLLWFPNYTNKPTTESVSLKLCLNYPNYSYVLIYTQSLHF